MKLNDELRIGEVSEVSGKQIKAGIYYEKNTEFLNFNGDVIKNVSIGSFVIIRKSYTNIVGKVEGEFIKENTVDIPVILKVRILIELLVYLYLVVLRKINLFMD